MPALTRVGMPWSGVTWVRSGPEIRTVGIAKSDPFCLPHHIEAYSGEVFNALGKERFLRNLLREDFIARLTHYFAEVNAIHPFREGYGRAQRASSVS